MFERFLQNITGWDLFGLILLIVSTIGFASDMPRDMARAFIIVGLIYFCLGCHARSKASLDSLHNKIDELTKQVKKQKDEIEELTEELKKR